MARFRLEDFKAWLADLHSQRPAGAGSGCRVGILQRRLHLLGMSLAHRGGRPCETLMQSRVIDRLGLQDTVFHPTAAMGSRLAEGHDAALTPDCVRSDLPAIIRRKYP
jgi:hypothetical protein